MLTLDQIHQALQDRKPRAVAEATGLSYQTIWRVQRGIVSGVSSHTLDKLSEYLEQSCTNMKTNV